MREKLRRDASTRPSQRCRTLRRQAVLRFEPYNGTRKTIKLHRKRILKGCVPVALYDRFRMVHHHSIKYAERNNINSILPSCQTHNDKTQFKRKGHQGQICFSTRQVHHISAGNTVPLSAEQLEATIPYTLCGPSRKLCKTFDGSSDYSHLRIVPATRLV